MDCLIAQCAQYPFACAPWPLLQMFIGKSEIKCSVAEKSQSMATNEQLAASAALGLQQLGLVALLGEKLCLIIQS